jgi:hypothetical protein
VRFADEPFPQTHVRPVASYNELRADLNLRTGTGGRVSVDRHRCGPDVASDSPDNSAALATRVIP